MIDHRRHITLDASRASSLERSPACREREPTGAVRGRDQHSRRAARLPAVAVEHVGGCSISGMSPLLSPSGAGAPVDSRSGSFAGRTRWVHREGRHRARLEDRLAPAHCRAASPTWRWIDASRASRLRSSRTRRPIGESRWPVGPRRRSRGAPFRADNVRAPVAGRWCKEHLGRAMPPWCGRPSSPLQRHSTKRCLSRQPSRPIRRGDPARISLPRGESRVATARPAASCAGDAPRSGRARRAPAGETRPPSEGPRPPQQREAAPIRRGA